MKLSKRSGSAPPASARRRRRASRGPLFVIAILLGVSGVLRLGTGAGHALTEAQKHPADTASAEPQSCQADPGAMAILAALKVREDRLAARESMIADQAQALALARSEIDKRLAALEAAEEKLAATLAQADQAAEQDVATLVAVYERMKPKEAAPLFEEMAPEFAAGFLARMRPDSAAAVLAGLDPKRAYTISVLLAGRNANAPRN
ncbi:MAG: hypothetical protein KDE08_06840 [Rhodobacteraceae bacterium]|nr:hypothetical protein [Paracoccaceae bacterium]